MSSDYLNVVFKLKFHSRITVHKDFPDDKCLATMNKAKEALRARVIPPSNYNLRRLFPRHYLESMNSPRDSGGLVWDAASWAVSGLVGSLAAAFMTLNDVRVHNGKAFKAAFDCQRPLVTLSNHHCCLDDPLIFAVLGIHRLLDWKLMRWSLAAHDVCFTKKYHGTLFSMGRIVPVVRGLGVAQPGMDFCINRLAEGGWVHIFPEGKVNVEQISLRLKWGVGRLVSDCPKLPTVLPIYHLGMDHVLPNKEPYRPRIGQAVTICVGKPIRVDALWSDQRLRRDPQNHRKQITDLIQKSFFQLGEEAKQRHLEDFAP